jgi:predicted phosphodiesterase
MRTIVFSDTHLTDDFDQVQCDYIVKLVQSVDQVILNGDFWDGYLSKYEDFSRSWQPLLSALASANTLYIPGNHDRLEWISGKASAFAKVHDREVRLQLGETCYRIQHGHKIAHEFDDRHLTLTHFFARLYWIVVWLRKNWLLGGLLRLHEQFVSNVLEKQLLLYARKHAAQSECFIFGHTHLTTNLPEQHYLNPGISTNRVFRYISIDEQGYRIIEDQIPEDAVY